MKLESILPVFKWLRHYRRSDLNGDLFAGITVGIMLIPQGMAYAMIAGLPPVYGLYASIVPQIIYAILGTSRQLSVAPVAMDSLLVATGVAVLAVEGTDAYIAFAILLAFFMGAIQLLLGLVRMGFITNLLSKPVITGFTAAAALIIALNQLKHLTGVEIMRSNLVHQLLISFFQQLTSVHLSTLLIGIGAIIMIKVVKRINKAIPGSLLAVIVGTILVQVLSLDQSGVKIVREIPAGLPAFALPELDLDTFKRLAPLALTLAVIAFMEAFSVAKAVEAKKKNYQVLPNQELIALGLSNVLGSFFQSYPVTGGFSRTAVNEQTGANTPLASVISAVVVMLTLLFITPLFYYLPTAILAAVIMVAVSGLIDFTYIRKLFHDSKVEFGLLLATFITTLLYSMVGGILVGIVLSILVLLYRVAYPHIAILGKVKELHEFRNIRRFENLETWDNLLLMRVDAPLSFINIQYLKDQVQDYVNQRKELTHIIIDAGPVSHMDASAIQGLTDLMERLDTRGITFMLCDVIGPVRDTLEKSGLLNLIGPENVFVDINEAVRSATTNEPGRYREYALQTNLNKD